MGRPASHAGAEDPHNYRRRAGFSSSWCPATAAAARAFPRDRL
ncbi:hypothetical protein N177_3375 [Lutibaculum baratangense AMV1]|uniref:Uncharacterized protein n=1 Tax=Lutibaculum baratangense AMV1 TaxID=631454 RepID=V4QU58_9HYPH|nr:hypothetical protein N177_3375 [Lutibaculum baratangense AMV1]